MDAVDLFLARYREFRRSIFDELIKGLSDAQVRGRPAPPLNPIAWLLWHSARVEDVGINRLLVDGRQVADVGNWLERMKISRRDVGTGMTGAEVDDLASAIDLDALRGYWDAVMAGTLAAVENVRGEDLEAIVPEPRVRRVANEEGGVGANAGWLTEFWAKKRTRAWVLAQTPYLHVYGHYYEARTVRALWGHPSP